MDSQRAKPRRWWLLLVLMVMAVAAALAWRMAPAKVVQPDTVRVERGDLERTVTAVGTLQPKEYVDVGTQVSGQLLKVHVEVGQRVSKGDLIAEVDPTRYESQVRNTRATLDAQRAQLTQRQAELTLAQQQLARNQRMLAERAVSQDAVDQARASAAVTQAAVAALKAQIKATEATLEGDLANLGYTKIYAPMDGVVVSQTSLEGQTVNASQMAPVIVQVANLDVMTVWAKVAEADVNKIQVGMPAYFTTLGMPGKRWRGTVRQVQPTPEVINDVVLFNALIDVENPQMQLLPSMTVQVFFVLGEARNTLVLPMSAVQRNGEQHQVQVMTAQGTQARAVEVGLSTRTTAQIVSGLEEGDEVVLDPAPPSEAARAAGNTSPRRRMTPRL